MIPNLAISILEIVMVICSNALVTNNCVQCAAQQICSNLNSSSSCSIPILNPLGLPVIIIFCVKVLYYLMNYYFIYKTYSLSDILKYFTFQSNIIIDNDLKFNKSNDHGSGNISNKEHFNVISVNENINTMKISDNEC
jgi:hypothetical protein